MSFVEIFTATDSLRGLCALMATGIGLVSFYAYVQAIFQLKTKPHIYTWLIWAVTQTIAVVGMYRGGAGIGGLGFVFGVVFIYIIFLLSFKFGTKNITFGDSISLALAVCCLVVWWQFDNLLYAVLLATLIDVFGYVPTLRKSYEEPGSEHTATWVGFSLACFLALISLEQYNLLSALYIGMNFVLNTAVAVICVARRRP